MNNKPMTKTDVINKVRKHFSQPDAEYGFLIGVDTSEYAASLNDGTIGDVCVYRGDHDASSPIRCAFGCLIPDELYDPEFDRGSFAADVCVSYPEIADLFADDVSYEWLNNLQRIHDTCARNNDPMEVFLAELDEFYVNTVKL